VFLFYVDIALLRKLTNKVRESCQRWYGHAHRRENDYIGKMAMALAVGRKKRGRAKR